MITGQLVGIKETQMSVTVAKNYPSSLLVLCDSGNLLLKGLKDGQTEWEQLWKSPKPENTDTSSCWSFQMYGLF